MWVSLICFVTSIYAQIDEEDESDEESEESESGEEESDVEESSGEDEDEIDEDEEDDDKVNGEDVSTSGQESGKMTVLVFLCIYSWIHDTNL